MEEYIPMDDFGGRSDDYYNDNGQIETNVDDDDDDALDEFEEEDSE